MQGQGSRLEDQTIPERERLIVVGNGMASLRFLERLTEHTTERYTITVVGAEPVAAYNRVLLSSLLGGEVDEAGCSFRPRSWYEEHGIRLVTGAHVTAIDRENGLVIVGESEALPFDRLVLAIGSLPIRLPLPGIDLPGVLTFRDFADVAAIRAAAIEGARAVVIGGGLLGLEAAIGLARLGIDVTLLHLMDRVMERQLDHAAAQLVRSAMEARGVRMMLSASIVRIEGEGRAERCVLADGTIVPADLVVMSVGIRPSISLARGCGLATERGITVDDRMTTSDSRIFALGECAEHRGITYGLVEPAYEQAEVLAKLLCGEDAAYVGTTLATSLKVSGFPVFSAGIVDTPEGGESIVLHDAAGGFYRKLTIVDGRLAGAVFVGDIAEQGRCKELIRSGVPLTTHDRDDLMFGTLVSHLAA